MRSETFAADTIGRLLRRRGIATMEELKAALGSSVDMTVFRKLRELSYLASYSHRGKYYALEETAQFDERGLWACREVRFSRFGSLVDTLEVFVARSTGGYLASELSFEVGAQVKQPLLGLVRAGRIAREEVAGLYLYCSADGARRAEQLLARRLPASGVPAFAPLRAPDSVSNEAKAAIVLFMSLLDEQQRRLFAGLEALRLGRGGDRAVAEATGLDPHTIAKGRQELLARDVLVDRRRRPGAGRKPVEKKRRRSAPKSSD
ncbi:MAG: hypothetical protein Q8Q28_12155 [Pseudomonadota bacterium]|nr:hypothetical protein [Pseudomonadota bacterium]